MICRKKGAAPLALHPTSVVCGRSPASCERLEPDASLRRIRVSVIFVNYGPYHLARARALAAHPQLDPYFIELASAQNKYPWQAEKDRLGGQLITLSHRKYDECSRSELSRKLVAGLSELQPHVVVLAGYNHRPMRVAARWARLAGVPVVMMGDSTEPDFKRWRWWEMLKRMWFRRYVDAAFVAGKASREYFVKLGVPRDRIWDCYDVVDNEFFRRASDALRADEPVRRRQEAGLPEHYFLFVGRFAPEKNLPFLLRAYARYRGLHPDGWRLVMVGDGLQREELLRIARTEGLNDLVWPGFKQSGELPLYYAFADCLILPSVLEPWGLVVNEAMASGLPVIVSCRCGSAADLVRSGENGFTFNPFNAEELTALMHEVATRSQQQRLEMSRVSRTIISRWTPQAWSDQLASAVRSAVEACAERRQRSYGWDESGRQS